MYRTKSSKKESYAIDTQIDGRYFKAVSLYGLRCCYNRTGKEKRALEKARRMLEEETDIVELLRFMRYFKRKLSGNSIERFKMIELSGSDDH